MRRIAHISDLHFHLTDPAVVEALAAELNADRPDLVAVSGDLTMRARSREFRAARTFLDRVRAPVLAVPGNHDITSYWLHERFLDPLGRWRRFIAEEPEPVWADGEIAVVGVNTASRAGAFLDWSQGRVGEGRLRRAVDRLRALRAAGGAGGDRHLDAAPRRAERLQPDPRRGRRGQCRGACLERERLDH